MTPLEIVLLFAATLAAGALNSVAGGGSFISFPTLMAVGVPPISANATNTIALWPGSVASVGAYRKELAKQQLGQVLVLVAISLAGGYAGARLLLNTDEQTFVKILPFLLLAATLLFAFGGNFTRWLRMKLGHKGAAIDESLFERPTWGAVLTVAVVQFVIAIYGGYFGGGIGILMLASLSILGMTNIHTMNGLKTLLGTAINGIAVIEFVRAGAISWPHAVVGVLGAIVGGYGGAALAQKLNPKLVRRFVIFVGVSMTIYFFVTTYFLPPA
ncbi:MAG: sulfite exporter TauE/SafE family protein [Anaerolineae bacterium]|nr:sulfite exporter TauE/SafE family protein [Anaerolineae bacterium]